MRQSDLIVNVEKKGKEMTKGLRISFDKDDDNDEIFVISPAEQTVHILIYKHTDIHTYLALVLDCLM